MVLITDYILVLVDLWYVLLIDWYFHLSVVLFGDVILIPK